VTILLTIFYVLVCFFLIGVVLLQQGKGADLAGAFGGGGSQTAFGPRSGPTLMHKLTTGSFVLFIVLSMALAIMSGKRARSVMEDVGTVKATPVTAPAAPAEEPPAPAAGDAVSETVPESTGPAEESAAESKAEAPAAAEQEAPASGHEKQAPAGAN